MRSELRVLLSISCDPRHPPLPSGPLVLVSSIRPGPRRCSSCAQVPWERLHPSSVIPDSAGQQHPCSQSLVTGHSPMQPRALPSIPSPPWVHLSWPVSPHGVPAIAVRGGCGVGKHVLIEKVCRNLGPPFPRKRLPPSQAWPGGISHGLDAPRGKDLHLMPGL